MKKADDNVSGKTVRKAGFLNNLKLRSKFYLVYIFCVMLPVVVTNIVIIRLVIGAQNAKRISDDTRIANAARYSLEMSVGNAVELTKSVYANWAVNSFLDTEYKSAYAFYSKHHELSNGIQLQSLLNSSMKRLVLYTANPTIISGGQYASIDEISDEEWYKSFSDSDRSMSVFFYFDESKRWLPSLDTCRTFSLVRRLDYQGSKGYEKLVKIDMNYNTLQRNIANANYDADVYICSGNTVVFTNTETAAGSRPFSSLADFGLDGNTPTSEFTIYNQDFQVYVISSAVEAADVLKSNYSLLMMLVLVNLLIPVLIISAVNRSMSNRIISLGKYFDRVDEERFEVIDGPVGGDEIGNLINDYNRMIIRMDNLIQVAYRDKLAKQQAEMRAIYSQVNPHFLFNALESIRMHSLLRREEKTADIIGRLSALLRRSLDQSKDNIPLSVEIRFANDYLSLQKYRFGDKLSYIFKIDDDCADVLVPKLSIVTFIENACVHGIENTTGNGIIVISAHKGSAGDITIDIEDTGVGMSEEQTERLNESIRTADTSMLRSGSSIGVLLAAIRLKRYYEDVSITIESEENVGTVATVHIKEGKYAEQSTAG